MARVTLDELNRMDPRFFAATLGDIFEHSPWIAEAACERRPFASLSALFEAMTRAVRDAGAGRQSALIKSHPDLAGKAAREGTLTADSAREQTSAGLDRLSEKEFAAFHHLNEAYRAKFDMPFVVCVRRHGKDSILRLFEQRLRHDAATEREAALGEILRIAALRLDQRVAAPDRLQVHGRLSTHVLDTHRGRPAEGVDIEFLEVFASGKSRLISRTTTKADGRTERPLIADPPFLDIVPVRFAIADPEAYYHIPLLVTPWSYATYRGS
jgi:2-oxo-4-hydroxy-4-carboxy-5-ureidoimidazoline decarboxylase